MQLACKELSLLSLQINSGFPPGIQDDNWYQNRAHLNNYVFKLQYINVTQNAIRSVSQQHSPLKYPVSPISVTKRGKEEHVIEKRICRDFPLYNKKELHSGQCI